MRTQSMYLVSGSFAALTMANPTLAQPLAAQDEMAEESATAALESGAALPPEQQAIFDGWAPDQQAAYNAWPTETQTYFWTLTPERQDLFWRLTDDNKISLTAMSEGERESAWQMIEQRASAVAGDAPAQPPEG
ncbi:MAG: hypothetical protein AAF707_08595 [Pseudomonadota bacterium]